jgi:glycogen debranching enzyme
LDEARITQQYYIATKASPTDDRARVLKYGKMFSVFDHLGDIQTSGPAERGLFFQGTRYLSEFVIYLWNARPLILSSAIKASNFLFTADLTNLDVSQGERVVIPRGSLHLQRSKFLWRNACYEEFSFINYGLSPLTLPFSMKFGADFADIFEVRGMHRKQKGQRLHDLVEKNSVQLSYRGLDHALRQTSIRCDPVPQNISGSEIYFEVHLEPREQSVIHLEICCDPLVACSPEAYPKAIVSARAEQKAESEDFPKIYSSNSRFTDWIKRSANDVQMMTVGNPEANYPYAGVPWFSTVFGRDGIVAALQMLWLNPKIAKGVLQYLAEAQATDINPEIEAEPGKILHETRRGEMAALGEIPFGRYYGSVDATPLFVMLAGAYYDRTGDTEFLRYLWPHVQRALEWIDKFGDMDGDGFVEYAQRSTKGLVQQGWKDSNDSVFHADGNIAEAPIALCEVQGYVYAAKLAGAALSCALGDKQNCVSLRAQAEALKAQFDEAFWCDEISTYALALDGNKKPCRVRSSNAGHCLYTDIATRERALRIAETLLSPDSFSGWGIRTIASGQRRYNPLSYHNGSIWPHDNSIIAAGLAKYDCRHQAGRLLLSLLDTSRWADLRRLPELFCGLDRRSGEGPTLYPVACSPQAWASGAVFLVLQACLGASVQDANNRIQFHRPYLPEGIPQLWITGLRSGSGSADLFFERKEHSVRVEVTAQSGNVEVLTTP